MKKSRGRLGSDNERLVVSLNVDVLIHGTAYIPHINVYGRVTGILSQEVPASNVQ